MKREIENKDWTDALKDSLKDFEVTPSGAMFERLDADITPEPKGGWWWPVLAVAAVLAAVGIFLFRPQESLPQQTRVEIMVAVADPSEIHLGVQEPKALVASLSKREKEVVELQSEEPEDIPVEEPVRDENVPEEEDEVLELEPEVSQTVESADSDFFVDSDYFEAAGLSEPVLVAYGYTKKKRQVTVGVSFGSGLMASAAKVTPGQSGAGIRKSVQRYDIGDCLEHNPQTFRSLDLFIPILDRFHIETGFSTTEMHAYFQSISQDVTFDGVPLRLGYTVFDWGWGNVSVNAGGMWEFCTSASLMGKSYSEGAQWSASAGLKASLHLYKSIGMYASPSFSYYFTDTNLPTIRNRQPLCVSVCAGIYMEF